MRTSEVTNSVPIGVVEGPDVDMIHDTTSPPYDILSLRWKFAECQKWHEKCGDEQAQCHHA